MKILVQPFGNLSTNCYIVINDIGETIIIDPGVDSEAWVLSKITDKPLAILNTHAHYDHVMGNGKLQRKLNIPLIIHNDDVPLLSYVSEWQKEIPRCDPNHKIYEDTVVKLGSFEFKIIWLPGHTLGTCIFDFGHIIFSGDFVMDKTIGRYNLFSSDKKKQFHSLKKFLLIYDYEEMKNITVLPGHGKKIKIQDALKTVKKWISFF